MGTHKTATTYVQTRLLKERERLARHGVAIAPHADVRRLVSDRLDAIGAVGGIATAVAKPAAALGLRRLLPSDDAARTVVISDENLSGPITSVGSAEGLYPRVGDRVATLMRALKGHDTTVFVCLRAYQDFLDSVYAYRAGLRMAPPADAFAASAASMTRGWPEFLADIAAVAGADRVVVWTYELFRRSPDAVSDALTGERGLGLFSSDDERSLPSLGRRGMAIMDQVSACLSDAEYGRFARSVARFQFDQPDERFSVLPPEIKAVLSARYERDLETVAASGCRMIG